MRKTNEKTTQRERIESEIGPAKLHTQDFTKIAWSIHPPIRFPIRFPFPDLPIKTLQYLITNATHDHPAYHGS